MSKQPKKAHSPLSKQALSQPVHAPPFQSQGQRHTKSQPAWLRVIVPEFDTVAHDPLDPVKRYHDGVFVETDSVIRKGRLFHVTGDIMGAKGMYYDERSDYTALESVHLHRWMQIGWVLSTDYYSGQISTILGALPTPTKQQGINFWEVDPTTKRHEIVWTKENGELYRPGEQRRPIFKCNEWTSQYAIPALRSAGVLRDLS